MNCIGGIRGKKLRYTPHHVSGEAWGGDGVDDVTGGPEFPAASGADRERGITSRGDRAASGPDCRPRVHEGDDPVSIRPAARGRARAPSVARSCGPLRSRSGVREIGGSAPGARIGAPGSPVARHGRPPPQHYQFDAGRICRIGSTCRPPGIAGPRCRSRPSCCMGAARPKTRTRRSGPPSPRCPVHSWMRPRWRGSADCQSSSRMEPRRQARSRRAARCA